MIGISIVVSLVAVVVDEKITRYLSGTLLCDENKSEKE